MLPQSITVQREWGPGELEQKVACFVQGETPVPTSLLLPTCEEKGNQSKIYGVRWALSGPRAPKVLEFIRCVENILWLASLWKKKMMITLQSNYIKNDFGKAFEKSLKSDLQVPIQCGPQ